MRDRCTTTCKSKTIFTLLSSGETVLRVIYKKYIHVDVEVSGSERCDQSRGWGNVRVKRCKEYRTGMDCVYHTQCQWLKTKPKEINQIFDTWSNINTGLTTCSCKFSLVWNKQHKKCLKMNYFWIFLLMYDYSFFWLNTQNHTKVHFEVL